MADDGKIDRLWDHLDARLNVLEERLNRDRLKEVLKEAVYESRAISELRELISRMGK